MRDTKVGWRDSSTLFKIMNGNHREVLFSSSNDCTTRFFHRLEELLHPPLLPRVLKDQEIVLLWLLYVNC